VTNQALGQAHPVDIPYFMRVLLFISFLSMGYALSRPRPASHKEPAPLLMDTTRLDSPGQEGAAPQPWQKRVSEKAVERYAATQDKKWQRWNEAMFERSD